MWYTTMLRLCNGYATGLQEMHGPVPVVKGYCAELQKSGMAAATNDVRPMKTGGIAFGLDGLPPYHGDGISANTHIQ